MTDFSHIDQNGNSIMVDVSQKKRTERIAKARGSIMVSKKTMGKILDRGVKKGDVLNVGQLAGIMGAKKTPDLIPLCHPMELSSIKVELNCIPENDIIRKIRA